MDDALLAVPHEQSSATYSRPTRRSATVLADGELRDRSHQAADGRAASVA
jgi:hypothetical protein